MLGKKVVVTTSYRGVFFGTLKARNGNDATLTEARNCLYWSKETKGFLGLSITGPAEGSRVGPAAQELILAAVTSISLCSEEAAKQWETLPWS